MKISVIIRCRNEVVHIGKLLEGILSQDYTDDIEIIVVDSGSDDGTIEVISKYPVKLISILPEQFSFGYALNVGCKLATGDILLFASAHVYPVYNNWIQSIANYFESPEIGLVYGRQIGEDKVTQYSESRIFHKWFPPKSDHNQKHPFCNNANCAIRKELWLEQKYNEELTGLEDLDWAKKMLTKGKTIAYASEAIIVHIHSESYTHIRNRYRREAIALKQIIPEEKFNIWDFVSLTISNIISDYFSAISEKQVLKNIFRIPLFRVNQFWGTYKGYKQVGKISNELRNRFYYPNRNPNPDVTLFTAEKIKYPL